MFHIGVHIRQIGGAVMRDSTRKLTTEAREAELDRLEREVKFSDDPQIRREATRKYLELTDKEPA